MSNDKTRKMVKVRVAIEEHLSKEVLIDVPESWVSERQTDMIIDKAVELYDNGEITLTADDFNGVKLIAILEEGLESEWEEFF